MPALILMYHDVSATLANVAAGHQPYVVDPAVFRLQMAHLRAAGRAVRTVAQWCERLTTEPTVVLTFDDGHVSNYDCVLPILQGFGFKATFFITAGRIGTGDTMTWPQIRGLHAAGMEIGSHTLTHRPPAALSAAEIRHELVESRRILEDGLGAPVVSISSPTGFFNPVMSRIAREAGYRSLCTGRVGLAHVESDRFSLNRLAVKRSMSHRRFRAVVRFDPLTLRRLQSSQSVRRLARKALGVQPYLWVRRLLMSSDQG